MAIWTASTYVGWPTGACASMRTTFLLEGHWPATRRDYSGGLLTEHDFFGPHRGETTLNELIEEVHGSSGCPLGQKLRGEMDCVARALGPQVTLERTRYHLCLAV